MSMRFNRSKLAAVVLSAFLLTSCGNAAVQNSAAGATETPKTTAATGTSSTSQSAIILTSDMVAYNAKDAYSDWKNEDPNAIVFDGNSATVSGTGAKAEGSKITITEAGVYVLSGASDNGQIIVDVAQKGDVKLVFNGLTLKNSETSPIDVKNAGKTIISLPEGTENTLTDGSAAAESNTSSDEPTAAIFSKDSLTVNGSGKLTVYSVNKDGITSHDNLKITGGILDITAGDDGLVGKDMVAVKDGSITIESQGDGIKTTNDKDTTKGFIVLEGGTFKINAGADGIQSEVSTLITGGDFTITTGGGSANAPVKVNNDRGPMGNRNQDTASTLATPSATASTTDEKSSKKALKAASDISITGGTFVIDASDDAVHSNNSVHISGGTLTANTGDDGIHADAAIFISNGKIDIQKSYEGIESTDITVSGGEIHMVTSDDGFNGSGGNDGSSANGPGQDNFSAGNQLLTIEGGMIYVNAQGDGLDSNGSIKMTGGQVFVSGPTANDNGAVDYNGTYEMSGGILVAAGSSGMAEAPSEDSTQNALLMYYPDVQKAGTLIHLEDNAGKTLVTFAPEKDYQSVIISTPDIKKNTAYTLYSGGTATGEAVGGNYTHGTYKDGTKVVSFTLKDNVSYLDQAGLTTKQGFGPGGGGGRGMGHGGRMAPPNGNMP
ncbi:MAG: carbohydrate-binding domain-containing protein [Clostridia bacterium]|nr:carbohydrate-binding domain-containing protein [Clostridia bacterium]